jgi:hypothetical protein
MSKIRQQTGTACMVCDEKLCSEISVILHKTRRQTHALCTDCAQAYFQSPLEIMANNLRRNIRKDITYVRCPGHYHGHAKNQCSRKVDITTLTVPECLPLYTDLFRITYILNSPIAFLCPNKGCGNVVDVDHGYDQLRLRCLYCAMSWCRQCLVSPYHDGKSCLEVEVENKQGDNAKFIWEMSKQGKVKFCPTCKSPIYRDGGCNKMLCKSCNTKFCWICRKVGINYDHYNGTSGCKGKLWEGTNT